MSSDADDDAFVTYSVRDLLERIDARLVRLDAKLDHKADQVDLEAVRDRVDRLEAVRDRALGVGLVLGTAAGAGGGAAIRALLG